MAVKTEQVEKNLVKLMFEVSAEDFEKNVNKVYMKNRGKINIAGFRKGKAPRNVIEKFYGTGVFYEEAINAVLPKAYSDAVDESKLDIVAKPEIDVDGEIKKDEPVKFVALVTTKPEVKLGDYKGIELEKIEHNVTEEDVDKKIAEEQNKNARMIFVEDQPIEKGNITVIDFDGSVDGVAFDGGKAEDYELEIGSNTFIPGFEDQLIGKNIGDEVDVNVTFPEEYHAENLKGKSALFKVKIKSIKKKELPELDDDFASEVSEFDTLDAYKKDVLAKLEKEAEDKTKSEFEAAAIKKVVENAEFDLPDAMVEEQIDRQVNQFAQRLQYQGLDLDTYLSYIGGTKESIREQFKGQATDICKNSLVLEKIVETEGIVAGEEEYELNLVDMAKKYNMELDKLKGYIGEGESDGIKHDIAINKAVEMIVNNAVVK